MNTYKFIYNNASTSEHLFESDDKAMSEAAQELQLMNRVSIMFHTVYVWRVLDKGRFSLVKKIFV